MCPLHISRREVPFVGNSVVRPRKGVLAAVALIVLLFPLMSLADLYSASGSLSVGSGLVGKAAWDNSSTTFDWSVIQTVEGGPLTYSYTFTAPVVDGKVKALSHLIIQVSDGAGYPGGLAAFALDNPMDYINTQGYSADDVLSDTYEATFDKYGYPVKPNPYMPDSIFGIKFEGIFDEVDEFGSTLNSWTVTFDSWRLPMEGDFYAVDGVDGADPVTGAKLYPAAWNLGLDPAYPDGAKILVPDTAYVPVPGAVLLGGIGLSVAGHFLRRKKERA